LTKFLGGVGHGPGSNDFNFGDDPDHRPDPGVRSPKSGFTGLFQKVPSGLRSKLQLICIAKIIQQFYYTEVCALWVLLVSSVILGSVVHRHLPPIFTSLSVLAAANVHTMPQPGVTYLVRNAGYSHDLMIHLIIHAPLIVEGLIQLLSWSWSGRNWNSWLWKMEFCVFWINWWWRWWWYWWWW